MLRVLLGHDSAEQSKLSALHGVAQETIKGSLNQCGKHSNEKTRKGKNRRYFSRFGFGPLIGLDCRFHDLDYCSLFGLIQPSSVVLLHQHVEESLPIFHFVIGAKIFQASARNIIQSDVSGPSSV